MHVWMLVLLYRTLTVGAARPTWDLTTYQLDIDDKTHVAKLSIAHASRDGADKNETGTYDVKRTDTYEGSATRTRTGYDFELALDGATDTKTKLSCTWTTIPVAPANAVRIKSSHDECSDTGKFSPATTRKVRVLHCTGEGLPEMMFSPKPGIEYAGLSEECYIQGAGYRLVRPDAKLERVSAATR